VGLFTSLAALLLILLLYFLPRYLRKARVAVAAPPWGEPTEEPEGSAAELREGPPEEIVEGPRQELLEKPSIRPVAVPDKRDGGAGAAESDGEDCSARGVESKGDVPQDTNNP
jgi:hypothetical protein